VLLIEIICCEYVVDRNVRLNLGSTVDLAVLFLFVAYK
jgi:hypothetical protein